jgi:hypothetical protein
MSAIKNVIFFLSLLFFSNTIFSQNNYEFFGILKLNDDSKKMITYRIKFEEKNGKINGYSITDLDGEHETKNIIAGTYDSKTKVFSFYENDILYTKSTYSQNVFCFVNFTGKIKLINKNSKLDGDFKGMFKNRESCIDGTLSLIGSEKIYDNMNKLSKKIDKKKSIDAETKAKINPLKLIDDLRINKLTKDQNLNVFWEDKTITIEIFDSGKEDGDEINLYIGSKIILRNYKVTNKKKIIKVDLESDNNVFTIEAINEGTIAPNTTIIVLIDKNRTFELMANLSKKDKASITFIKKDAK